MFSCTFTFRPFFLFMWRQRIFTKKVNAVGKWIKKMTMSCQTLTEISKHVEQLKWLLLYIRLKRVADWFTHVLCYFFFGAYGTRSMSCALDVLCAAYHFIFCRFCILIEIDFFFIPFEFAFIFTLGTGTYLLVSTCFTYFRRHCKNKQDNSNKQSK